MNEREKELLNSQVDSEIRSLYKYFLSVIEDIQQKHLEVLHEIRNSKEIKNEVLIKWNYLDLYKYSTIRKGILDKGNDAIRKLTKSLEYFDIKLKD